MANGFFTSPEFLGQIQRGVGAFGEALTQQGLLQEQARRQREDFKNNLLGQAVLRGFSIQDISKQQDVPDNAIRNPRIQQLLGLKPNEVLIPGTTGSLEELLAIESAKIQLRLEADAIKGRLKERSRLEKEANIAKTNFDKVESLFSILVGQWKGSKRELMESTIGRLGRPGAVIRTGVGKFFAGKLGAGIALSEAFEGQKNETAFALNKIITGQNRVIGRMIELIRDTLPDIGISGQQFAQKVRQSVRNAVGLNIATKRALTPKFLNSLTDEQIAEFNLTPEELVAQGRAKNEMLDPNHPISQRLKNISPAALTTEQLRIADAIADRILATPAAPKENVDRFGNLLGTQKLPAVKPSPTDILNAGGEPLIEFEFLE